MPRRERRAGLRAQLTALVAAVMLAAIVVIFILVYTGTGREMRQQIARDVAGDTGQLAQAIAGAPPRPDAVLRAARVYLAAQPYGTNAALLFVVVPGAGAAFNHPEIVPSSRPDGGESSEDEAAERGLAAQLLRPRLGWSEQRVPDIGPMRMLQRRSQVGAVPVIVGAGEPLAIVERAQHGVAQTFGVAGLITIALALIAAYFAGARLSAPLRRMAGVASRVDAGELESRMDASRGGGEVAVLAEAFNHMLDRLTGELKGQREFIADASHELRTPITVIRGQIEVLAAQEHPSPDDVRRTADHVQREITRISRLVDDLLLLAQAEHGGFLRRERIELRTFVEQLWDGISLTADRRFELGEVPRGALFADPDRIAQALRNLAGNAVRHTAEPTGLVRLEVAALPGGRLRFTVVDDGPGIPESERERVFERFHRTDPARSRAAGGAGLGLAIVRAIADAHHGDVRAVAPLAGRGARLELTLPGFEPAPVAVTHPQQAPVA
ncbi:MAG TPA: ATP-binding protein [Solirubrobacteraceae bacterium]|nr:ATP-binding protein [Solirubrobacteraceae bacterium]